MDNSYGLVFRAFRFCQRMLRGSGLGNYKVFRDIRDFLYGLVRPSKPMMIRIQNIQMHVDPKYSGVVPELLRDGVYEAVETDLLRSLLKEGSGFVDIGGNIGYYTLIAADVVKNTGRVLTFEPEPDVFEVLKKNVALNGFTNITLVQKALSDRNNTLKLYIDKGNTAGHHLYDLHDGSTAITVDVNTLDDYLAQNPMNIDVIKMDIEGYEPYAVRGMKRTLGQFPAVKILCEFCPEMLEQAGNSGVRFLDDLHALGFRFSMIDERTKSVAHAEKKSIIEYCAKHYAVNLLCQRSHSN